MSRNMYEIFKQGREGLCELENGHWTREEEFKKFIVAAKTNAYGQPDSDVWSEGQKTIINYNDPAFPDFSYRDTYYGAESFRGIETISIKGVEIYALTYSGIEYRPFKEDNRIFECLSKALKAGPEASPDNLRGLDCITDNSGRYEYHVWYSYFNGHVIGTEIIIDTEGILVDGNNKIKGRDLAPSQLIWYAGKNDIVVFRCDFAGGFII